MNKGATSRNTFLDYLKGIAMLGVILAHYSPSSIPLLYYAGWIGGKCPQLFFIISAFLTWKSLDNHANRTYATFLKQRFKRIVPIYYLALIVALVFPSPSFSAHSVFDYVTHATFINGLFPAYVNSIMHVEWYIADLAIFYFSIPFLRKIAYNFRSSTIALFFAVLLSSLSIVVSNHFFGELMATNKVYEAFFHTFFILNQLPAWLCGVVVYYLVKEKYMITTIQKVVIAFSTLLLVFVFLFFHLNDVLLSNSLIASIVWSALFLLLWSHKDFFTHWAHFPIVFIGKYSFGIYCFHNIIITCFLLSIHVDNPSFMIWLLGLIVVIIVSSVIGFSIEKVWSIVQKRLDF